MIEPGSFKFELHLVASDDPLEACLEIIVTPPVKKPQTLSLLSGGEQAQSIADVMRRPCQE
jgi:chromosome segregation protein